MNGRWERSEVVAWTDHDGPERPQRSFTGLWVAAAVLVAAPLAYVLFTDTLCPEHRMWVQVIGSIAMVSAVASVVGLIRGWSIAPALTALSAALGVVLGVIDMVHDPSRGALVAAGFGAAFIVSVLLIAAERPAHDWDRSLAHASPTTEVIEDLERALTDHGLAAGPEPDPTLDVKEPTAVERD